MSKIRVLLPLALLLVLPVSPTGARAERPFPDFFSMGVGFSGQLTVGVIAGAGGAMAEVGGGGHIWVPMILGDIPRSVSDELAYGVFLQPDLVLAYLNGFYGSVGGTADLFIWFLDNDEGDLSGWGLTAGGNVGVTFEGSLKAGPRLGVDIPHVSPQSGHIRNWKVFALFLPAPPVYLITVNVGIEFMF